MNRILFALLLILTLLLMPIASSATSESVEGGYYIVFDENGEELFATGSKVVIGDMYQSSSDFLYEIIKVDADECEAWARFVDKVTIEEEANVTNEILAAQANDMVVGIYQTHSSESYIPSDGTESKKGDGGILDVGKALADELEKNGIKTIYSDNAHDPHDAGAYQRSRRTAMSLIKQGVDVLVDVHRDAIPAKYYAADINGSDVSRVRLVVGRQNPNQSANKQFAQKLKQIADKKYPGLIKDIYFARGGYNQDLGPQTILIEVGTHKISKEDAEKGAQLFAGVISDYLGAGTATQNTGTGSSIGFLLIATILVVGIFMFINYGSWEGIKQNVIEPSRRRYASTLAGWRNKNKK